MKKSLVKNTASSIPVGIGIGLAVSLLITIVGAAVAAFLLNRETLPESAVGYAVVITLLVSACIGALVSMRRIKRLRFQMCLLSGAVYFLALLAINALFFGGQYDGVGMTALVVFGGTVAVAIIGSGGGKGLKFPKKRSAYR